MHLSVNVFSTKVLIGDTIFTSPTGDGTNILRWSSKWREGVAICRAKAVSSFLSHFETLSTGPVPGTEPATSRSAVKRSTNWTELILLRLKRILFSDWLTERHDMHILPARSFPLIGSLSNNDGDGYEDATSKVNSGCFKLYRAHYISLNSSNACKFFWSWNLKDCIKVQEKKTKVVVLCTRPRQNMQ